jgi:PAS domain S-box-containing protein
MLTGAHDEIGRLQALRKLAILDTECEDAFDELTKTAALVCQVPIALISLIDEHRQWFKSRVGLDACETPREFAFCAHAIRQPHHLMEISDATKDVRFANNPLVIGPPGIRFYAGAPLVDADGHALGTLCVIDSRPRTLDPWQREVLNNLARQIIRLFAVRRARAHSSDDSSSTHRAANSSLTNLVQQVPTGVVSVGPHGRLRLNSTASKMIGFSEADLPNINQFFEKLYGAQAGQIQQVYNLDKAQGFPSPTQSWILCGDGQRRLIEIHGVMITKEEFWLLRDVTETIGAQERFRVLFEHSSDAHLLFDENGIIDCNNATITMLRYRDKNQILSLHPARLSPELQPDGRRSDEKCIEMDRLAHEKGYHRFEWQHRRMDGTDFPVEVTLTPVMLSGKSVLLVVWHDLTERKLAEQIGREREQRWTLALQAIGDGLWDWDLESNRVFFSTGWKQMLGYEEKDIGDTLDEWDKRVHPEDKERTYADIKRHLSGEVPNYKNEHRALCRDGTWKWILDRGMVVERYSDGRPKRMVGTHTDLTERRRVEEQLKEAAEEMRKARDLAEGAARTKADFLATMSHELRTPMNGVIGMTSLLLDTPLDRQQKEYTETARACGDQLLTLINDILDFSKIEAGSLTLEKIPYSPRHLGEESIALLAEQAEKKGLQTICLIGADVPSRLLGDPTRLRQIILNLLSNAVKFTERGEVVLSISRYNQETIDISVRDTGVGISSQASQKLFQPFVQADSSTTRKYGGTGLGLVICQRLIQLMGGEITLESKLGEGSTFSCRLPLSIAEKNEGNLEHQGLIGCHVLVIAPSATIRRSLREQLISWGMSCDEANNESGIPAALARRIPALVVIDHQVTNSSLPLEQQIFPSLKNAGIPLVLLAGGAQRGMANAAKEAGFSGFLTKPVRQVHLFECLLLVINQTCAVSERPRSAPLITRHTLEEDRSARRILLVEDNEVNRQVAVAMLNKLDCRCDIATNGQEAVHAISQHDYQIVFMDCQMPIMDGFEATKAIRRSEGKTAPVRIIALTANAMEGDRERCLDAGMDDYLTKPLKMSDLEIMLKKHSQLRQVDTAPKIESPSVTAPLSEIINDTAMQDLLSATDLETLRSVVELIRAEADTILVELRASFNRGDLVSLARSAHRFKGAVGTLGLIRVHLICSKLEQVGRKSELGGVAELIQALEAALVEALPVLANHQLVKR